MKLLNSSKDNIKIKDFSNHIDEIKGKGDRSDELKEVRVSLEYSDISLDSNKYNNHSALIWQGFQHRWKRKFLGFAIPHRIRAISNFISEETHQQKETWTPKAKFTLSQRNTVDGNYMYPRSYYSGLSHPGLFVSRGHISINWIDEISKGEYPKAENRFRLRIPYEMDKSLNYGNCDNYVVILRGFSLNTHSDDHGEELPHGFWPYRMYFSIENKTNDGKDMILDVKIDIFRAWTPNKGGLPYFDEKILNNSLRYNLILYFTIIGGNSEHFNYDYDLANTEGRGRDKHPIKTTNQFKTTKPYKKAVIGINSFGFELYPLQNKGKYKNRGRYIGGLTFKVNSDNVSDTYNITHTNQLWFPQTVIESRVKYTTKAVKILLDKKAQVKETTEIETCICINSHDSVKFYSQWKKCGKKKTCPRSYKKVVHINTNKKK